MTQVMSARTRLNDTTCLYLRPILKAGSLSTLIAVEDNIDTADKTTIEAAKMENIASQLMSRSVILESTMIATVVV